MATTPQNPVVIIGGGYCGIISLKICLENGLRAICLEKTDQFGGLWRFRPDDQYGVASVTRSTIINTSKEMSAISDFPPPAEYANYMHNSKLLAYLESYICHFHLEPHIRNNQEVTKVEKNDDYDVTGQWKVWIKDKDGNESEIVASAVMVCIGHHVFPHMPSYPGLVNFSGTVMHSHSYKDFHGMEQKNVVVVGVGNSGMDAAVELSFVAKQVYLSTRRGAWIIGRLGKKGIPFDFGITRFASILDRYFTNTIQDHIEKELDKSFDHALYNLKPRHRYNAQHPSMNDALPARIISGAIMVKNDIGRFTSNGAIFKGEEDVEYPIDAVVFCTGYDIKFPFLGDLVPTKDNDVSLYMRMLPPELKHPTLAIIALTQTIGPIFPAAEIQARWMAQLIKGESNLPPVPERLREIEEYKKELRARYVNSQRHTIQVDMVPYMDSIAEKIGCKPNLTKMLFTDPALFWKVMFGPSVSYQYRLTGPHKWDGARDAIMTVEDRFKAALSTRYPKDYQQLQNPLYEIIFRHCLLLMAVGLIIWLFNSL